MEFQYEERICGVRDVCADSMVESDDEETLSFCDMPLYHSAGTAAELESAYRVSNADSSDHHDFHFDLAFGRSSSMAYSTSSADDLFHNGRLLPLTECTLHLSHSDSNSLGQNGVLLKEELQAWRSESLESKSSYWTKSSSNSSQASHRSFNYSASQKGLRRANSTAASNKSKDIANWTSFSSRSCRKTSSGWLQFFTLGVMKTPAMKVEDMRLRQCKRDENGAVKADLRRSVSSYYEEGPILREKAATFRQRSKSVKENKRAVETPRTKGLRMFPLFPSLNACMSSISSAINCTKTKVR